MACCANVLSVDSVSSVYLQKEVKIKNKFLFLFFFSLVILLGRMFLFVVMFNIVVCV